MAMGYAMKIREIKNSNVDEEEEHFIIVDETDNFIIDDEADNDCNIITIFDLLDSDDETDNNYQ